MKLICLTFIILSSQIVSAQVHHGPRLTALGSSGVALQDYWAVSKNQAGLSEIASVIGAVCYEQRFVDENISLQSAVVIYPESDYVFALKLNRYGVRVYNDQQISLACSRKWGDISIGLGFNFHQLKIHNYGASKALSVDIGFQYQFTENITLGGHVANPSGSSYNSDLSAPVPVIMDFGAAFKISNKVLLTSEIQKELESEISFRLGTEYSLAEWLAVRGGVSSNPLRQYFGFGISRQKFRFDAATYTQYYLGFVPQIGFSYEF